MSITRKFEVLSDTATADVLLKVAFATSDGLSVDQHFGSASGIAIYGVNPQQVHMLTMAQFGHLDEDGNEDKLANKLALLEGCVAVYCRACGASAVRQLLNIQVHPVKVTDDVWIKDLITALQEEMKAGPSGWLAKAIGRHKQVDVRRFDDMEAEGWQD